MEDQCRSEIYIISIGQMEMEKEAQVVPINYIVVYLVKPILLLLVKFIAKKVRLNKKINWLIKSATFAV